MSHDREAEQHERVHRRLRELPAPAAAPAFRERLRREFIADTLRPSGRWSDAYPDAHVSTDAGKALDPARTAAVRRRATAGLAILLPAAAGLLVVLGLILNRPPSWQVVGAKGTGSVIVNGQAVPASDHDALRRLVRTGARITTQSDVELMLRGGGLMALVAIPETEFSVPQLPGRWFGRNVRGTVTRGEIRGTTGPSFAGRRLFFTTPEALVEVTGTTFAVIRDSTGSCVCVLEGRVRFGRLGRELEVVEEQRRRVIFRDGRPPFEEEIPPMERMKLEMLRDQERGVLDGARR